MSGATQVVFFLLIVLTEGLELRTVLTVRMWLFLAHSVSLYYVNHSDCVANYILWLYIVKFKMLVVYTICASPSCTLSVYDTPDSMS